MAEEAQLAWCKARCGAGKRPATILLLAIGAGRIAWAPAIERLRHLDDGHVAQTDVVCPDFQQFCPRLLVRWDGAQILSNPCRLRLSLVGIKSAGRLMLVACDSRRSHYTVFRREPLWSWIDILTLDD